MAQVELSTNQEREQGNMSSSYDWRKVWITDDEATELQHAIGVAIETGDTSLLPRAREIANAIKFDLDMDEE